MKMSYIAIGFALAGLAFASPVAAAETGHKHESSDHDHAKSDADHGAKHGGQFQELADHHGVEMVVTDKTIVFHITHDHQPEPMAGSAFKAIVQSEAGTSIVQLAPDGSTLKGTLANSIPKGAKIALSGKDEKGGVLQARFVLD